MMTLKDAIQRERLSDELRAIQFANVALLPGETYEQNLERRAKLEMRKREILSELSW